MTGFEKRNLVFLVLIAALALALPAMAAPVVLYDGTVSLIQDATFTKAAYNTPDSSYTIQEDTPLGALQATGLSYDVTDKNFATSGLLLDNVDIYLRKAPNYWYAYVNDVYKDGYNNLPNALNLIQLNDGDKVEFYYAPTTIDPADLIAVKAAATAAVLTVADIVPSDFPSAKFSASPVAGDAPLTVQFTDASTGITPLTYEWDFNNDGTVDSAEQNPAFDYTTGGEFTVKLTVTNSLGSDSETKISYIKVIDGSTDWSLELTGAREETVTKSYFENGLACPQSGHQVFWTDGDGNNWGGVPLWVLAGMVDDNPDVGPLHYNFNDAIAAQHYSVNVVGKDGTTATLDSARIARNDNIIVANTLNGKVLPMSTSSGKPSWPLHLKGAEVLTGEQIGEIATIELTNLPEPSEGWTLSMLGQVGDTITQKEFEEGLACTQSGHLVTWTQQIKDTAGNVIETHEWSGVPLWVLLGTVDDIENSNHWTFSDTVAASGYTARVWSNDGVYYKDFAASAITRNSNYLIANMKDGQPLSDSEGPLRLVGSPMAGSTGTLRGTSVSKIAKIEILELQTPAPATGSYNLALKGKITDVLSQAEIEQGIACPQSGHLVEWTQVITKTDGSTETHVWSGIPLYFLAGWVDDRQPHDFNTVEASAGYTVVVKSTDGFSKTFPSGAIAYNDAYIVATMKDGAPLPNSGDKPSWPLQLVGTPLQKADGSLGGGSVNKIVEIELTEFNEPVEVPTLHIVKYGDDGTTVVAEATLDYNQMMTQFDVIGDGVTKYSYQGVTMDPTDIWGQNDETKGGSKVSDAVRGTRLVDLVSLVGGMGEGTDLVTIATDGYKISLPYTSVYTTPEIQERQGDAILAWYANGKYVPEYSAGMRLFFMPEDHIYGQWDMHESMPAGYWHYYYQAYSASDPEFGQYAPGILYPSAAGTSNQNVVELRVYTLPEKQWTLKLDGTRVGGIEYTIAKGYFEAALACQMGANHEASFTDSSGNVWIGMPLWFLAGFVDDADQHSNNAYNKAMAEAGYDITVIGGGNYAKVFDSVPTIRSNDYIVANTKNGFHISDTDTKNWPLKLIGNGVASSNKLQVGGINTIVLNLRPKIDSLTIPTDPVKVNTPAEVTTYFTDPYDTHTAVIDWGDGSTSAGVVDETAGSVTGSHQYTASGFYTVKVTLTDSMYVTATKTATEYVVVYNPKIGEVSGSGTINVLAGEYATAPAASGKSAFSLLGKYDPKGAPSGNVKLALGNSRSTFQSAFVDYVIIKSGTAYIHGMGSIDKSAADYEFLLVAKDGGKTDTFRLQVWDSSMTKVFDNAPEAGAKLNADIAKLTGGSIVIQ